MGFILDFDWTPDEQKLREFVIERVRPTWTLYDRDMPTDAEVEAVRDHCRGLAERGLLTPGWPARYGGRDASMWEQMVIHEELWGAGEPRGNQYMNVTWIGPAIMLAGSDEQKDFHLPRISAGE